MSAQSDQPYPPVSAQELKETSRGYRDDAAAALFKDAGGLVLVKANTSLQSALLRQAEKLQEFHSTPFTTRSAKTMLATLEAIERIGRQMEQWHYLIYPNQRPKDGQ